MFVTGTIKTPLFKKEKRTKNQTPLQKYVIVKLPLEISAGFIFLSLQVECTRGTKCTSNSSL